MDHNSNDTGSSPLQQTKKSDSENIKPPRLSTKSDERAAETRERRDLREALAQSKLSGIDEIFLNNASLVNGSWVMPHEEMPLHYTCRWRFDNVVEHLLNREDIEDSVQKVDSQGFLPPHRAIQKNCRDSNIFTLIELTSQIGLATKTEDNDTLIHLASRCGQVPVLDKLCTLLPERWIDSTNAAGSRAIYEGIDNATFFHKLSAVFARLRQSTPRIHRLVGPEASMEGGRERGTSTADAVQDTTKREITLRNTRDIQSPLQILVVPQLWLWKFDSECKP